MAQLHLILRYLAGLYAHGKYFMQYAIINAGATVNLRSIRQHQQFVFDFTTRFPS